MSTGELEEYLAVLRASYDYTPQSDDEIAIKGEQLLLLLDKVDDDWWKVKIAGNTEGIEHQTGLVPAAYVEQAPHTSVVKAVYDYEATAPGELSVHEDDVLYMFYNEEDWILVQDSMTEGRAGYVPGNYVEVVDEEDSKPVPPAPTRIIVPDSPPKPAYVDPADRVASTKVTADDIKTWSVSEIDKKGKKKKGTLGIGNGSLFFASESDKTPVQKWQTKDVTTFSSERAKHVQVDISGPNPTSLHFHAGSKENTDAIMEKLQSSRALTSDESENVSLLSAPSPAKKPSVHFSPAAPTIIPGPEEPNEEQDIQGEEQNIQDEEEQDLATALYDFNADGEDELTVKEGENIIVLERDGEEWWKCRNANGLEGVVPASYLEAITRTDVEASKENDRYEDDEAETRRAEEEEAERQRDAERLQREQEEDRRRAEAAATALKEEAQRKAKESAAAAQAERQRRKEAAAARAASPPVVQPPSRAESPRLSSSSNSRVSADVNRPPPDQTRTWHDRTGQFRVEAAFLGFNDGKLRLHKVNGVIVEVPSEKMSLDDMRYVEKITEKRKRPSTVNPVSDDDIPLAITKNAAKSQRHSPPQKKGPQIDWFDFFLSAGCDLDDCTRYAASFEKDKMDVTLLNDITEGTMRSLGLREGDIIRVKKAIEKRKPTDSLHKPSAHLQDQIRRDEELARQLQAQENANGGRASAPNLFAGPGGVLKPRRGRPQTSKSLPPTSVDLNAISSASGQIRPPESPNSSGLSSSTVLPARSSSALAPVVDGFDDDAWTNRASSAKPVKSASSSPAITQPRASLPAQPKNKLSAPTPTSPPQPTPTSVPTTVPAPMQNQNGQFSLARTTEADILDQLARLSDLRKNSGSQQSQQTISQPSALNPPSALSSGMPMGSSPLPMGQVANSRLLSPPPAQSYNGPRGPYAPVPANQGLLQPLIPTQTGFSGFIPIKSPGLQPSFQNQLSATSFLHAQPTGFQNPSPVMTQPTGAFGNFGGGPFQGNSGLGSVTGLPIQTQATSFPQLNQSPFANGNATAPPPPNVVKDSSPASIFAQMKSGTFAKDDMPSAGVSGSQMQGQHFYQGYTGY